MEVKELSCTMSKTINTGNFNSLKVEWSETIILQEGDDPLDIAMNLRVETRNGLMKAIAEAKLPGG